MNKSTIPYSIVEERRRLNKCIENAPNECEREIYRKIRDMKIPYDKLDTILETSKELIKEKEKQRKIKKRMLFLTAFPFAMHIKKHKTSSVLRNHDCLCFLCIFLCNCVL